jgi:hypothetical protein
LLLAAIVSFSCVVNGFGELAPRLIDATRWPVACQMALLHVLDLPNTVVFAMLVATALRDAREARQYWSWLAWTGAWLSVGWFLLREVHFVANAFLSDPVWEFIANLLLSWSLLVAAVLIAYWLLMHKRGPRTLGPPLDGHRPNRPRFASRA